MIRQAVQCKFDVQDPVRKIYSQDDAITTFAEPISFLSEIIPDLGLELSVGGSCLEHP